MLSCSSVLRVTRYHASILYFLVEGQDPYVKGLWTNINFCVIHNMNRRIGFNCVPTRVFTRFGQNQSERSLHTASPVAREAM